MKIDAHAHLKIDDPDYIVLLEELDIRVINVSVRHHEDWRTEEVDRWRGLAERYPDRAAWITTFDPPRTDEQGFDPGSYAQRVIEGIRGDVESGAVGCKVWKNIGMEAKKPDGSWLMIDDEVFEPVFAFLAEKRIPLLAHIGEPLACWQPADAKSPHSAYYAAHPEWHFYGRKDHPSHGEIIEARDRMLANHPDLHVVGAHLASLEYDLDEIADRLDRFPNLAVDTSARMWDLAVNPPERVAEFIHTYRNRILWGTDIVDRDATARAESWRRTYTRESRYYETAECLEAPFGTVTGVNLDAETLDCIYRANALAWYPKLSSRAMW